MLNLSRVYSIFLRQLFLIQANPVRLVNIFLWVVIDVIQWGFITKYVGSLGADTFSFVTVVLGAIILWEFMSRIQLGTMQAFLEDIWSRNFVNIFAAPIKVSEYIAGLVLTSIITSIIGFWTMVLIAGAGFGYNIFQLGMAFIPFVAVLLIFGVAVGIFMAAVIFRFGPSAEWIGWPIPFVMSIFSGVFYPIETLPAGLALLARLVPASYVFESMRAILVGSAEMSALVGHFAIGFGLSLVYVCATYALFRAVYRHNLRTGMISRFQAE